MSLAFRIVFWYGLFSALWITLSDRFLLLLLSGTDKTAMLEQMTRLQTAKGFLYITLSALLVGWLAYRDERTRRKAEEQLRNLSQAAEQSANTIVITDVLGHIEYINPRFTQTTGYTAQEAIGQNPRILKSGDMPPEEYRKMWQAISSGQTWQGEFHNRRKDGSLYWEHASISPVKDDDGAITHYLAVKEDVTARKAAEDELRRNEEMLTEAQEIAHFGSWEWDIPGGGGTWSDETCRIFGFPPGTTPTYEEFLGIIHPGDRDAVMQDQREAAESGSHYDREYRIVLKDGTLRHIHAKAQVHRDKDGKPLRMTGVNMDITERKLLEQQLQEINSSLEKRVAQEVAKNREKDHQLIQQSRLAAMGEMIHNIAHQWRQPLNALSLQIGNIKDAFEYKELDAAYLEQATRNANQLIQKMSATIDNFRNFFQPGHEKQPFQVLDAVREAMTIVDTAFDHQHIAIEIVSEDDVTLSGYISEFSQVLLNIFNNAREIITERNVPEGRVEIRISHDEKDVRVSVRDNGGGASPEILAKIFEPYFSTKVTGTGIGLYMSKMIVEKSMGGHIEAANTADGMEFVITCPLRQENGKSQ